MARSCVAAQTCSASFHPESRIARTSADDAVAWKLVNAKLVAAPSGTLHNPPASMKTTTTERFCVRNFD